ncbi:MAG: MFS transporter [Verrucomicrobiae bacterium]|nr:MFS transporter [Verrucomicrobiae bacterium]
MLEAPPPTRERADGTPLTDRQLRRGLRLDIFAVALGNVWAAVAVGAPFTMFWQALGASGVTIGLASMVQQLAVVAQLPGALLTERFRSRKWFWIIATLPHRVLWLVPALLVWWIPNDPERIIAWTLIIVSVSAVMAHVGAPAGAAWIFDLVPTENAARFWGRRHALATLTFLISTWAAGYLLDRATGGGWPRGLLAGFAVVFFFATLFGIADVLVHGAVPEIRVASAPHRRSLWDEVVAPWRNRDFRWMTLAFGAWGFAAGMAGPFALVYLREEFQITYQHIFATQIVAGVGSVVAGMQAGYIIDRLGARAYGMVLLGLLPVLSVSWFFLSHETLAFLLPWVGAFSLPQPVVLICLANLAAGALGASLALCQVRLLSALTPREGRPVAIALHWTVIALLGATGPIIGGLIKDLLVERPLPFTLPSGVPVSYFHLLVALFMALTWCVCIPLYAQLSIRKGDLPVGEALPRLWLANPLRAVRHVYSLHALTAAVTATRRADAIRHIATQRATIATADLAARLDDPSFEVREEAAYALGQLGTREAFEALIQKLNSPHCDLQPQIARALRYARHPDATRQLVTLLTRADRTTVCEAARSLGYHRDNAEAAEALRQLAAATADDAIFAAAADGLARLRDQRALPIVLDRWMTTSNPTLRGALRLNIADMLGERGEFYRLWDRERAQPGSEADRLLDALRERGASQEKIRELGRAWENRQMALAGTLLCEAASSLPNDEAISEVLRRLRHPSRQLEPADVFLGMYLLGCPRARGLRLF